MWHNFSNCNSIFKWAYSTVYGFNERVIELILENMVCMELLRRGYDVSVRRVRNMELDFIGKRDGECVYIQICYLLASDDTVEREFGIFQFYLIRRRHSSR